MSEQEANPALGKRACGVPCHQDQVAPPECAPNDLCMAFPSLYHSVKDAARRNIHGAAERLESFSHKVLTQGTLFAWLAPIMKKDSSTSALARMNHPPHPHKTLVESRATRHLCG